MSDRRSFLASISSLGGLFITGSQAVNISISIPGDGSALKGMVPVTVTVTPTKNLKSVALLVDGTPLSVKTAGPFAWEWDTTTAPDGPHDLRAVATYKQRTSSADLVVNVANEAVPPPPPPSPPPGTWWTGFSGYTRLPQSQGATRSVSSYSALTAAIAGASAGERIQLDSGTYSGAELKITRDIPLSTPITIEPAPGASVVLGTSLRISGDGWRIGNGDPRTLLIDGGLFQVPYGVWLYDGLHSSELFGVTIKDVSSTNGGNPSGIYASRSTSDVYLVNVICHRNGRVGGSVLDHGMYLKGDRYVLCNVLLTENAAFGVQFYDQLLDSVAAHVTAAKNGRGGVHSGGTSNRNRVFNSIGLQNVTNPGFENISSGSYAGDHLLAFGNGGTEFDHLSPLTNAQEVDPKLDAAYKPLAGGPAIGFSDVSWSPPFDLYLSARYGDCGAIQR